MIAGSLSHEASYSEGNQREVEPCYRTNALLHFDDPEFEACLGESSFDIHLLWLSRRRCCALSTDFFGELDRINCPMIAVFLRVGQDQLSNDRGFPP